MNNVARISSLSKIYGTGETEVKALKNINLDIFEGEFIAIVGASGSGKSTLLNMLGGLDRPTEGTVEIGGERIFEKTDDEITKFRRRNIGFIFQEFNLVPVLSVYENIVFPIQLDGKEEDKQFINEIVDVLGIGDKVDSFPEMLSGGQRQRVAIARALATKPKIILADEPTGSLDSVTTMQVMELLMESAKKFNQTIIMITHNEMLSKYCNRVLYMNDGILSEKSEA